MLAPAARAQGHVELPQGPGRDLVYGQCRTCHDLQYLKSSAGITRDDWDQMLISMRQYGMRIPPEQRDRILDYLGTYLGPTPPPSDEAKGEPAQKASDGATVFNEQCVACHKADGSGEAGQFPPLAGNSDLFLEKDFPVLVVLHGMEGSIAVSGKSYKSVMPPFDHLSDKDIAGVVNYVRSSWGNAKLRPSDMDGVNPADVAEIRAGKKMSSAGVADYRKTLK